MDSIGGPSGVPLRFSKLAVIDFDLLESNFEKLEQLSPGQSLNAVSRSHLQLVDTNILVPEGAGEDVRQVVASLKSQACPRFVPTRWGTELMFLGEDPRPRPDDTPTPASAWGSVSYMPSRWVALAPIPSHGQSLQRKRPEGQLPKPTLSSVSAALVDVGEQALPQVGVRGCPEFVPSLYPAAQSLAARLAEDILHPSKKPRGRRSAGEERMNDTFVMITDPPSTSVLGVDAQALAVSLATDSRRGAVSRAHLLYNIDVVQPADGSGEQTTRLQLKGCQPIRSAGREGRSRLEWVAETMRSTLTRSPGDEYVAWLACLTADQRVAIVESPDESNWMNMSMPYPVWTGKPTQDVWCPRGREEACFEVWSNPNPNN